jgi:copper chaperone
MTQPAAAQPHEDVFVVADMTCSHCVSTITKALTDALKGAAFRVELAQHRVIVPAGAASVAADAMREAGFEPVLQMA